VQCAIGEKKFKSQNESYGRQESYCFKNLRQTVGCITEIFTTNNSRSRSVTLPRVMIVGSGRAAEPLAGRGRYDAAGDLSAAALPMTSVSPVVRRDSSLFPSSRRPVFGSSAALSLSSPGTRWSLIGRQCERYRPTQQGSVLNPTLIG
jgi:hypothetical protein